MGKDNNEKVVFIYDSITYFIPYFIEKGIPAYPLFSVLSFIPRLIRRLFFILKLPKNIWYAGWKDKLRNAETLIIFSTEYNEVLTYVRYMRPDIRVIYWYWNPVFRSTNPNDIPNDLCEKWSFDKNDCEQYNMKYNTTFYFDNVKLPTNDIVYDVVFLGVDKGRRPFLNNIMNQMSDLGLKPFFYIVDDDSKKRDYKGLFPNITYEESLCLTSKSKAILDYIQDGQTGITLRPMEALFFRKKLITNNKSIKTQDFYTPENVFIIGIDKMEDLEDFINTPYKLLSEDILKKYDVNSWLGRFFI